MPEYIERGRARREFAEYFRESKNIVNDCDCLLCCLPTADVAEVRHGEWVIPVTKEPWREGFVGMCTNCGYTNSHIKKAPKFCEGCGARMDEKVNTMREILFRGKRVDNGEWIYGDLLHDHYMSSEDELTQIYNHKSRLTHRENKVIPETVGQYTGLTDKNGKKIFEGDICRFREWSNGDMCWIGKVHYEHQQFVISGNPNKECERPFTFVMSRFISEIIEVIGNIHDNPELLDGKGGTV